MQYRNNAISWPIIALLIVTLGSLFFMASSCGDSPCQTRNACGGCEELAQYPTSPCGPCGMDRYVCDGAEAVTCDGHSQCNEAALCTSDDDCSMGHCSNGHCARLGEVFIPACIFTMGSDPSELGRVDGEDQYVVELSRAYFMQTTEVMQGNWEQLMGFNPSYFHDCGANCPVENISWYETLKYANALSTAHGLESCYDLSECTGRLGYSYTCTLPLKVDLDCEGYRLPTEAEWEHAYRAGTRSAYYNGDVDSRDTCEQPLIAEIAVFCGNCSVDRAITADCSSDGARPHMPSDCGTQAVATKVANGWGLYDMSGNVYEFVWDIYGDYPEEYALDPIGAVAGSFITIRGSGFCGHTARLRAADRKYTSRVRKDPSTGFRLVRSVVGENSPRGSCPPVDDVTN